MSFLKFFSGNDSGDAMIGASPLSEPPFHVKALQQLNLLDKLVKEMSNQISTDVYSKLRDVDDVMRPLIKYLETHDIIVEQQVLISSILTDYIPTSLDTFRLLPEEDKVDGDRADLLLQKQYDTIYLNAKELADEIYGRGLSSLSTQAIFIENKFSGE